MADSINTFIESYGGSKPLDIFFGPTKLPKDYLLARKFSIGGEAGSILALIGV